MAFYVYCDTSECEFKDIYLKKKINLSTYHQSIASPQCRIFIVHLYPAVTEKSTRV